VLHIGILSSIALREMPPTLAQQIGLSAGNFVRWYVPVCLGTAAFYWATKPEGGALLAAKSRAR
jgi:hypothetical protein